MKTKSLPRAAGEAAHTPTPYYAQDAYFHSLSSLWLSHVRDASGSLVANVCSATKEQTEANAAFIVRACNSHAALVAALERLDNAAGRYQAVVHTEGATKAHGELMEAHKQARAALAAAKGVQS